jgi:hypothetical protein
VTMDTGAAANTPKSVTATFTTTALRR